MYNMYFLVWLSSGVFFIIIIIIFFRGIIESSLPSKTWRQTSTKIKEAMKRVAFQYLCEEKNEKSKLINLNYSELKIQNYFISNLITTKRKLILFRA